MINWEPKCRSLINEQVLFVRRNVNVFRKKDYSEADNRNAVRTY